MSFSLTASLFYPRYLHSILNAEWSVDLRHVLMIYETLKSCSCQTGLEIGAYYGTTTCAFVEAAERRPDFSVFVCDVVITDAVRNLVNQSPAVDQITIIECESARALQKLLDLRISIDIAFLDGSHVFYQNAIEAAFLQCLGARTLLLHDTRTQSSDQYGRNYLFDGPKKLLERFRSSPMWFVVEDSDMRCHEQTHRGLALVTRDREVWERTVAIFSELGSLPIADVRKAAGAPG